MKYMNRKIRQFLKAELPDYVGFADLARHEAELLRFGGKLVAGYRYGISIGIAIPDSIADLLPDRFDPNVACDYRNHGYHLINDRLNRAASRLSSFLNGKGHRTLPLTAADRTNEAEAMPTVSH
ncbi:MAG: hypothetical protein JW874_14250, partial [Spirochaetales bacterium]|nr:hypothetical protein [Spirochaetales bacterium]